MNLSVYPGSPFPLGATWNGQGVNFALFSENATAVELCLFDNTGKNEISRIKLEERTHHVWHVYITGLAPGQYYAYRVHGEYKPAEGHRFNPNKLLIDPYAKELSSHLCWDDSHFGYKIGDELADLSFDEKDNAEFIPKSVVTDKDFDWEDDRPPKIEYHKTIIYETHVKGLTALHPQIPENIRGTYAAVAHPVMIEYFKKLGITAVELMPIHAFINDRHLEERKLTNYWGYNTICFFAPEPRYSSNKKPGTVIYEFKNMVKELHKAGIEVILDVVYNHTAEGNHMGPTLSFRGIDNVAYYRLTQDKRYYMDYTGTGNTLHANMPNVLRLIMDSLRYWVIQMHVDGFRFDLASTLARELHEVDRLSAFFHIIHQDPVISQTKLIAEPWDIDESGYMVGGFPPGWAEWNGRYRDCMRDFWKGANSMLSEFAERFTGSSDLYKNDYRSPTASINFITAHDGFTLHDLVSYNEKHNEANGENNKDGETNNRSWNCGAEGPTNDEQVVQLRNRQKRNFLTTLFLSQGVPMLVAGDELGKTQNGNNNAYCQDNEISWIDWEKADNDLLNFTRQLISIYQRHDVFSRKKWFKGQAIRGNGLHDIAWFMPDGKEMNEENWKTDFAKSLAVYLNGLGIHYTDNDGKPIRDEDFYIIFNAHEEPLQYKLPARKYGDQWIKILDTADCYVCETNTQIYNAEELILLEGRSIVLLRHQLVKNKAAGKFANNP